jgi:hypothetical protein
LLKRFGPASRDVDRVAGASQQLRRELRRAWLVVDDQKPGCHATIPDRNLAGSGFLEETMSLR